MEVNVIEESGAADDLVLRGHTLPVTCACISGDGGRVISGSVGRKLRVWDLRSGRQLKVCHGHKGTVYAVASSAHTGRVVSASEDRSVRVWDIDGTSTKPLAIFTGEVRMRACGITPDGNTVIAGEEDGRIHVLRLEGLPAQNGY